MSIDWNSNIDCKPRRLKIAIEEIEKKFYDIENSNPTKDMFERMKYDVFNKVKNASSEEILNDRLLSKREAKVAVWICRKITNKDNRSINWQEKAFLHISARKRQLSAAFLFDAYQDIYWNEYLRKHLQERIMDVEKLSIVKNKEYFEVIFRQNPISQTSRLCSYKNIRIRDVDEYFNILNEKPLSNAIKKELIINSSKAWLQNLVQSELDYIYEHLEGKELRMFFTKFVRELDILSYSPDQIDRNHLFCYAFSNIVKHEGDPKKRESKWSDVPKDIVDLVKWWTTQHEIDQFFSKLDADPYRKDFWRKTAKHITDLRHYRHPNAFAMRIGDYYFVEFGDVGNALYIYNTVTFNKLTKNINEASLISESTLKENNASYWSRKVRLSKTEINQYGARAYHHDSKSEVWQNHVKNIIWNVANVDI
ncbi:MAG TPA: EH signature domain-containing protein [bacterium]|nr:EH signature domain-containing protein [bacterium]